MPQIDPSFMRNFRVNGRGCWIWVGRVARSGPQLQYERPLFHSHYAYRVSYEMFRGPIPNGMTVDHRVCNERMCVNPQHLQLVTRSVNTRRENARRRRRKANA